VGDYVGRPVLFIHGISDLGGAERELLLIVERLESYGYTPFVVLAGDGVLKQELRERNIETFVSPLPPWRKLWALWRRPEAVRCLRNVIQSVRPELIHVNDIWWVPQTVEAVKGLAIPVIGHVRQEIETQKAGRYWLERVDRVLAVSRQVHRSLELGGVAPSKIRTLYSGLDDSLCRAEQRSDLVRRWLGIPQGVPVIGTVANLFPRKGYEVMLRALPEILAADPAAHYVIVGGGNSEYEQVLKRLVHSLKLVDRVHFVGAQQSVYPYVALLDLYVHPALMEGFGIAVLEAMAMGKAVVATKTGGVPEIVVEQETGLLVEPNDRRALAQAVVQLLNDPAQRSLFGRAGQARVQSMFTVEAMMKRLVDVYQGLHNPTSTPSLVARA
jgi:glycosyltransferase involved in cell wall biosynthesis